jgi:hypothetical protein
MGQGVVLLYYQLKIIYIPMSYRRLYITDQSYIPPQLTSLSYVTPYLNYAIPYLNLAAP